ncbi:hypothetical protein MUP32_00760 [Candidatus Microgenomates bacterium]|nr:hypothetical protein [Candidatus Microgenomates bacterium]
MSPFGSPIISQDKIKKFPKQFIVLPAMIFFFIVWLIVINKKPAGNQPVITSRISPSALLTAVPTKTTTDKLEIAQRVIKWLSKQETSDGAYYLNRIILPNQQTVTATRDRRVGVNVLWGKYKYWQKTKDPKMLVELSKELNTLEDKKLTPLFQPDFWSCRFLYEIWTDKDIGQDMKDQADSLCSRASFVIPAASELLTYQDKEANFQSVFSPSEDKITLSSKEEIDLGKKSYQYPAFSSDFAAKYMWHNNENDLRTVKALFNLAVEVYQKQLQAGVIRNECVLGIASLDLYRQTNDSKYLSFAGDIYSNDILAGKRNLFRKIACYFFVEDMNAIRPNAKYSIFKNKLLGNIMSENYDAVSGSFFSDITGARLYETRDNALMLKILSE